MSKSSDNKKKKLLVIGAGLGGLGGAWWARKAGHEVEVLEASDRAGGRACYVEHEGDRVAVGAQFFHVSYGHAKELLKEMGLYEKRFRVSKFATVQTPKGPVELKSKLATRHLLGWGGRLSAAWFGARHAARAAIFPEYEYREDVPDLDDRLLSDVSAHVDERFYNYVVLPGAYGFACCMPTHTSALHGIRMIKASAPPEFLVPGGTAALAEALAERLPVEYETPAKRLLVEGGWVVGAELEDGSVRRADHVLVATSADVAGSLVPEELPELRSQLSELPSVPILVLAFFLDRPYEADVASYWDPDGPVFKTVILQQDPSPSGRAAFMMLSAYPQVLEMMEQSDDALIKQGLEQLERAVPGFRPDWVRHAEVKRHTWGIGHFPPGQYKRYWRLLRTAEDQPGLSLADVGGTHMEATLRMARAAVGRMESE